MAIRRRVSETNAAVEFRVRDLVKRWKADPRHAALALLQFIFVIVLLIGIYFYADPSVNVIPWPMNAVAFALTVLLFVVFSLKHTRKNKVILMAVLLALLGVLYAGLGAYLERHIMGYAVLLAIGFGVFYLYEYTTHFRR
ncbi:MAG: hypothetical protein HY917_01800 [Candidatus Diapherotrites archaeon]|nr:hypothetical protein [Candidatus Diapherotrites archaeon]